MGSVGFHFRETIREIAKREDILIGETAASPLLFLQQM